MTFYIKNKNFCLKNLFYFLCLYFRHSVCPAFGKFIKTMIKKQIKSPVLKPCLMNNERISQGTTQ